MTYHTSDNCLNGDYCGMVLSYGIYDLEVSVHMMVQSVTIMNPLLLLEYVY